MKSFASKLVVRQDLSNETSQKASFFGQRMNLFKRALWYGKRVICAERLDLLQTKKDKVKVNLFSDSTFLKPEEM